MVKGDRGALPLVESSVVGDILTRDLSPPSCGSITREHEAPLGSYRGRLLLRLSR